MAKDVNKMRWEVIGGSIRTEEQVEKMMDFTEKKVKVHLSVAHNVGRDIAERIVRLHNTSLVAKEAM